jgi:hypothetical protein
MPIRIKSSRALLDRFDVVFEGDTAWVEFYPNALTMGWAEEQQASIEKPEESMSLLAEVLHDWDIYEDGDDKIPVTVDGIRTMPIGLVGAITDGCVKEAQKRAKLLTPYQEAKTEKGIETVRGILGGFLGGTEKPPEKKEEREERGDE